jgi:hypothetical protein
VLQEEVQRVVLRHELGLHVLLREQCAARGIVFPGTHAAAIQIGELRDAAILPGHDRESGAIHDLSHVRERQARIERAQRARQIEQREVGAAVAQPVQRRASRAAAHELHVQTVLAIDPGVQRQVRPRELRLR